MIKAIIFDLDGTLLNTLQDLYLATNEALIKNHMPERSLLEVKKFVGNGVKKLILRAMPANQSALVDGVLADFKAYYNQHSMDHTVPYDGIIPMLKKLHEMGLTMAIVSNKFQGAVNAICAPLFKDYMNVFIGEDTSVHTKPHPDMIYKALDLLNIEKDEAILIGDSEIDIETARNANLPVIGVDWGFRGAKLLNELKADYIAYIPQDIIKIIKEINLK